MKKAPTPSFINLWQILFVNLIYESHLNRTNCVFIVHVSTKAWWGRLKAPFLPFLAIFSHQQLSSFVSDDDTVSGTVHSAGFCRDSLWFPPPPPLGGTTCSDLCTLVHAGLNCASCSNSTAPASAQVLHWSSAPLDGVIRPAVHFIVYTPWNGDICEKANKNIPPARNATGISSATPGYDSFSVLLFSQNAHEERIVVLCAQCVCVCVF